MPPVRPIFSRGLGQKRSNKKDVTSGSSTIKLSVLKAREGRQPASGSSLNVPLDDRRRNDYAESSSSKEGIWKTADTAMQWEDDTGEQRSKDSLGDTQK